MKKLIRSVGVVAPKTVEVPIEWLKTLYKLSEETRKAQDKWYLTNKPLMPMAISKLVGFASSAKTILKTHKNMQSLKQRKQKAVKYIKENFGDVIKKMSNE